MKEHILKLDKDRELRFGFKAMREIETAFGNRSIDQILSMKFGEVPKLVMIGLKWDDKNLTEDQVCTLLDAQIPKAYTIVAITEAVFNALAEQMGIEKVTKEELEKEEDSKKDPAVDPEPDNNPPLETEETGPQKPINSIPSKRKQKPRL